MGVNLEQIATEANSTALLYTQYVLSKKKKPRRIPLGESLEIRTFIRLFILFLT